MSDEQCGADPFENGYDQKLSEKEYRERIKYLMRCHDDSADEIERLRAENERLRDALKTYACRCGDGDCYKDEFVASCGRSAREALGLILNANSLNYAQEIASKALSEQDTSPCPTNTIK
jgi:hypothetical protein